MTTGNPDNPEQISHNRYGNPGAGAPFKQNRKSEEGLSKRSFPPRIFSFYEPEDEEEKERAEDIQRMHDILSAQGCGCSHHDLFRMWKFHSKSAGHLWMKLPESDSRLFEIMLIHLTEI
jgi:hypothetical protein